MRSSGVHHVDLVVSSTERSLPFYRELLGPLGYTRIGEVEGERGETIWYLGGAGCAVGLRQAQSEGTTDRYRVGLHHVAFNASSRELVDERHEWLVEVGATIESAPREYGYIPGYYAVFFYDPDGIKLEIVHVPAARAGGRLGSRVGIGCDLGSLAAFPDQQPAFAVGDDVLDLQPLVPGHDHELGLVATHRLVLARGERDRARAVFVGAFADELEHAVAGPPGVAPFAQPLVQGAEADLVLGHPALAGLHDLDSMPIENGPLWV